MTGDSGEPTDPDVLVLRQKVHGRPAAAYREELAARLPDHEVALAGTATEEDELLSRARVATGIRFDAARLTDAPTLELFGCAYAGTGHLERETFADHGVAVTSASGVHAPNISEYVVGSLVAMLREFRLAWRRQDSRVWQKFDVGELSGSTVTVVGMGSIGTTTVERLNAFDVETVAVRHSPEKGGPADRTVGYDDVGAAFAGTDHLVLTCPLTDLTEGLVGPAELQALPPEAILVNVARGPVVQTDALVEALRRDELGGAVLDVTDPEPLPADHALWDFENVRVTPHNAGNTPRYFERAADILAENVRRLEAGEQLHNRAV
jgi:phosphoglycerate dehydrogenase-like enzyme